MFVKVLPFAILTVAESFVSNRMQIPYRDIIIRKGSKTKNGPELLKENVSNIDASTLLADEVSNFGMCTALADEHIRFGNYEEARKLAEEAVSIGAHTGEINNIYAAYAEGILADVFFHEGDYKEAATKYREALKIYEHHFQSTTGPETIELVGSLQLTAWTLLAKREYEKARVICASALGMSKKLMGPNSTMVASSMANLAIARMNTGDLDKTPENLLKNSIAIFNLHKRANEHESNESVDDLNNSVGLAHINLGDLYYMRGNDGDASRQYKEVEALYYQKKISPTRALGALKNLALIEWRGGGNNAEADRLLTLVVSTLDNSPEFGVDHEQTVRVRSLLKALRDGTADKH